MLSNSIFVFNDNVDKKKKMGSRFSFQKKKSLLLDDNCQKYSKLKNSPQTKKDIYVRIADLQRDLEIIDEKIKKLQTPS